MKNKYVGISLPIKDAVLKATGKTVYTDDLHFPGMLHGKILFSDRAHARIKRIDTSKAEKLQGVEAVITYKNSPEATFNSALRFSNHDIPRTEKIFDSTVRYVGDRVAAVAAVDSKTAAKALKLIEVEYEDLPANFDPEKSLQPNSFPIHPNGNIVKEIVSETGNVDKERDNADLVIESKITTPMVHHCAIEPHVCIAHWSLEKKLTVWSANQNVFATRLILAELFQLPLNKVRVVTPTIGGAFGGKLEAVLEPVAALLSKKTGRHVKIQFDRKETMVSTRTRHSSIFRLKTGITKQGKIISHEINVILNTGAYATSALNVLGTMCGKAFKLYKVSNMRFSGVAVYTNLPIAGAMRGYGSPQLIAATEIHMDKIAKILGCDPVNLRLKNLVHPYDSDPRNNESLGNCRVRDCLKTGAENFNWYTRKKENNERYKYGFGVSCGLHSNGVFPAHQDFTAMTLKLNEDGSAILLTGIHDLGTGTYTSLAQIVAEILDIKPSLVEIVAADTENTPYDLGCYASRNTWVGGAAAKKVAEKTLQKLKEIAADILQTEAKNIFFRNGFFSSPNVDKKFSIPELVSYSHKVRQEEIIACESYKSPCGPNSYAAHFAHVRVDTVTGEVKVLEYTAVHDIGKAINPLLVQGQIEGGIQMGIGLAISEELKPDSKSGKITNAHLKKYKVLKAKDMPKINISFVELYESKGPFGAKSIGEIATVPVAPAVVNAINDALGTFFSDLPVTPEKILNKK